MKRMLHILAVVALALLPPLAAATPSDRGADPAPADAAWQPLERADRADAFADLALADDETAGGAIELIGIGPVSVSEPSIAALFSTALIWLLAIYWRLRRERGRRRRARAARRDSSADKPALPRA